MEQLKICDSGWNNNRSCSGCYSYRKGIHIRLTSKWTYYAQVLRDLIIHYYVKPQTANTTKKLKNSKGGMIEKKRNLPTNEILGKGLKY